MPEAKPAIVVALTGWKAEPWVARFRALLPGRTILTQAECGAERPARYHLFCWKPSAEVLAATPYPLLIASAGAGVDHILRAKPPAGVPISRVVDPDLTGRMVEYVVLHALMHLRRMPEAAMHQRARRWKGSPMPAAREVTVGLLGIGVLGQAAAAGLAALGFRVIGWSRTARGSLAFETHAGEAGLGPFLAQTDILVSLLPSTPETRGLIGTTVFRALHRDGAFGPPVFINAGRGDTVREDELIVALGDGTLRAASLDVFTTEPLPEASPLWGMETVILTPHNAADSTPDAVVAGAVAEIHRFEAGLPLKNLIDPKRGY
ncbi:MAG: glyoxylate/hydroxypyruvate reductase A [Proteobacteria bacterium]|nr:glyoxylate/hydroxypyruvate reductase A [Pseudomonadota bacterium]